MEMRNIQILPTWSSTVWW